MTSNLKFNDSALPNFFKITSSYKEIFEEYLNRYWAPRNLF